MAGDRMRFIFELVDRASRPASSIASAIRSAERALVPLARAAPKADKALGGVLSQFVKFKGAGPFVIDPLNAGMRVLSGLADVAVQTVSAIASASWNMGEFAVKSLAFKESTLTSFRLMLGTEQAATRVFDQAVRFAARTPLQTEEVVRGFKSLLSAGFTEQQLPVMFQALGDIHAASGFNPEVIPRITAQFAQIKGLNRVTMEDLRSITNWSGQAGIGVQAIWAGVAKRMNTTVANVAAMQHAGTLSADAFFGGFLEAVATRSGGKVGGIMEAQADSLVGLWSTISSVPSDMLLKMSMKEVPGFDALKGALINVRTLFDETSEAGKRVQAVVKASFNSVFTQLFGDWSGPEGLSRMEELVRRIADGFERFVAGVRVGFGFLGGVMSGFAQGLGVAGSEAASLFEGPLDPARIELMVAQFRAFGRQLGKDLGTIAGLAERILSLFDRISSFTGEGSALRGLLKLSGMHPLNPLSGLFAYENFRFDQAGGEAGRSISGGPILESFGGRGAPASPGGGRRGAGVTVVFSDGALRVDARGQDGETLGKSLRETLVSELGGAFEELGLEAGVA
jgi:hypothetical protein